MERVPWVRKRRRETDVGPTRRVPKEEEAALRRGERGQTARVRARNRVLGGSVLKTDPAEDSALPAVGLMDVKPHSGSIAALPLSVVCKIKIR